jgi:2-keto-3-deoxy-L-rhamnonate aldolase RhmA
MPLVETREAIADFEAILDVEGVNAVWPGLSDLAEQLGHPMDYEHPDVTAWLEKVIEKAHARGIAVCANDGMAYVTPEAKARRLVQLRQMGVDMLEFAPAEHLAYIGAVATIDRINELLGDTGARGTRAFVSNAGRTAS